MNSLKDTKIMATMGPTLSDKESVARMLQSGVKCFRIHMGLRTRDLCGYFKNALDVASILEEKIEVILDLPSSRPRVGNMESFTYVKGDNVVFEDINESRDNSIVPLPTLSLLTEFLKVGDRILFRDGRIIFKILKVNENSIETVCERAVVEMRQLSSCAFPDSQILFDPIVQADMKYLTKMCEMGMEPQWIALSFTSDKKQIQLVREVYNKVWGNNKVKIMAKIESKRGLDNIDEIIEVADGIMIARGDLLLCVEPDELPFIQEKLVRKCKKYNKIVVVATEFFEKHAETGIINRSELSDVYLAAKQKSDYIMLARETGNNPYIDECIKIISKIIKRVNNNEEM